MWHPLVWFRRNSFPHLQGRKSGTLCILKMESSEMLVPVFQTTQHHITEYHRFTIYCSLDLKSHTGNWYCVLTFPSRETMKRDFDPPAMRTGLRADNASEYTGSFTLDPLSPPSWSLSFSPHTNTLVLISGLESTACPFCWVANILTSCWKNYIPQQGATKALMMQEERIRWTATGLPYLSIIIIRCQERQCSW